VQATKPDKLLVVGKTEAIIAPTSLRI